MKPREWWIDSNGRAWSMDEYSADDGYDTSKHPHVIEKSAFDELAAEVEHVKVCYELLIKANTPVQIERDELRSENDRLQKILDTSVVLPGKPSKEIEDLRDENRSLKGQQLLFDSCVRINDKVRAANAALVEALKKITECYDDVGAHDKIAFEALAKHGGGK